MATDPKLESYLTTLERALQALPVSDRADIVTEIKSHVLDALDRDKSASTDSVLDALGAAETVANRYLMERGIQHVKPPISPVFKWIVVGFVASVGIVVGGVMIALFTLRPLIKVDADSGRTILLGGLVDINDNVSSKSQTRELAPSVHKIVVDFSSGHFTFTNAEGRRLHWECRTGFKSSDRVVENGDTLRIDLSGTSGSCEIAVPADVAVEITGKSGKLELEAPRFAIFAKLHTGRIVISPDDDTHYHFALTAKSGTVGEFKSVDTPNAIQIRAEVDNGSISNAE